MKEILYTITTKRNRQAAKPEKSPSDWPPEDVPIENPIIEVFSIGRQPVAAIVPHALAPDQRDRVYRMLPSEAVMNLQLAKRWGAWAVMCSPDWARAHWAKRPRGKKTQL